MTDPQNAPTIDGLTAALLGTTVTQGWDVVHAMSASKVNELFQRQFVLNLAEDNDLPPIDGSVPIVGNLSVQLVDLVLASPLIAFTPRSAPGTASITIPIVSGLAHLVQTSGAQTTVLATQWLSLADGYTITGLVPLGSVQGQVKGGSDVVLMIEDGHSFASDLGMPRAAGTLLGEFLLTFLQEHSTGYRYALGTIDTNSNGTSLTPTTFEIATQVDGQDPTDQGRVLLFIATSYHPGGGSQTVLALANVVPAGMDATLFVASATLFGNIIAAQIGPTFGGAVTAPQLSTGASELTSTGGSADAGFVSCWDGSIDYYGSGTCQNNADAVVPLAGVTLTPAGSQILGKWNGSWLQQWFHQGLAGKYTYCNDAKLGMSSTLATTYTPSVDPVSAVVSFASAGSVGVDFDHSSIWSKIFGDGSASDTLGAAVRSATQSTLAGVFKFTLPDVAAFAVSSLLFPGEQVSSFTAARVPGDLMLCGTLKAALAVTPAMAQVATGGTATFSADEPVTWAASLGRIDSQGNYTAPARLARAATAVITATDVNGKSAYAAVIVVPAQCLVSPLVIVTQPGYAPQQFIASVPGATAEPTWTISPPAAGQIDSDGNYTPPSSVSGPTLVTVTATIGSESGTATVLVTPQPPGGVAVTPYVTTPLAPGQTQQFSATVAGNPVTPTWSLWPPGAGTIDAGGAYQAPTTIAAPQGVVLLAQDGNATGTAVILLSPDEGWMGGGRA